MSPVARHHRLLSLFAGDGAGPGRPRPGPPRAATAPPRDSTPAWCCASGAALRRSRPTVVVAHGGDPLKYLVPAMLGTRDAAGLLRHGHLRARGEPGPGGVVAGACPARRCRGGRRRRSARAVPARSCASPRRVRCSPPTGATPTEFHPPERVPPAVRTAGDAGRCRCSPSWARSPPGKRPDRFVEVVAALRRRGVDLRRRRLRRRAARRRRSRARPRRRRGDARVTRRRGRGAPRRRRVRVPEPPHGRRHAGGAHRSGDERDSRWWRRRCPGCGPSWRTAMGGFVVDVDDLDAMVDATARLVAAPRAAPDHGRRGPRRAAWSASASRPSRRVGSRSSSPSWSAAVRRPARAKCARYPARPERSELVDHEVRPAAASARRSSGR